MALGLLDEYSSHSDISNSDDEDPRTTLRVHPTKDGKDTQGEKPFKDEQEAKHANEKTHPLSLFTVEGRDDDDDDDDNDDDHSSSSSSEETEITTTTSPNFPLPDLDTRQQLSGSAFRNPYKEAEEARLAVLKQHVGDFAKEIEQSRGRRPWRHRNERHRGNPDDGGGAQTQSNWSPERQGGAKRKQRSGVVDCLVPPQKALKLHQQIQAKERPWTMRP
eukprot:Em0015g1032a